MELGWTRIYKYTQMLNWEYWSSQLTQLVQEIINPRQWVQIWFRDGKERSVVDAETVWAVLLYHNWGSPRTAGCSSIALQPPAVQQRHRAHWLLPGRCIPSIHFHLHQVHLSVLFQIILNDWWCADRKFLRYSSWTSFNRSNLPSISSSLCFSVPLASTLLTSHSSTLEDSSEWLSLETGPVVCKSSMTTTSTACPNWVPGVTRRVIPEVLATTTCTWPSTAECRSVSCCSRPSSSLYVHIDVHCSGHHLSIKWDVQVLPMLCELSLITFLRYLVWVLEILLPQPGYRNHSCNCPCRRVSRFGWHAIMCIGTLKGTLQPMTEVGCRLIVLLTCASEVLSCYGTTSRVKVCLQTLNCTALCLPAVLPQQTPLL